MESTATKNNRHVPRLDRRAEHSWQLKVNEDELITKNIMNISPTGLAFKAPLRSDFKCGQKLRVHLSLEKDQTFECEGKIVWVKRFDDFSGKGQQFGLQFLKVPSRADSYIMKEINNFVLRERRFALATGQKPGIPFNISDRQRQMAASILGIFLGLALTSALIAAVYLHQRMHPEDSLAYKINQAFLKRMTATSNK